MFFCLATISHLPLCPAFLRAEKFDFLIQRCWSCPAHCESLFRFLSDTISSFNFSSFSNSNDQTGTIKITQDIKYPLPWSIFEPDTSSPCFTSVCFTPSSFYVPCKFTPHDNLRPLICFSTLSITITLSFWWAYNFLFTRASNKSWVYFEDAKQTPSA